MGQQFTPLIASVILAWFYFGRTAGVILPSCSPLCFAPTLQNANHSVPVGSLLAAPFSAAPTNTFWTPLITGEGRDFIAPLPYFLQSSTQGLSISYPDVTANSTDATAVPDVEFTLDAQEALADEHRVTSFDELSVWIRYSENARQDANATAPAPGSLLFPVLRGSPYVTAVYTRLTPVLRSAHSILNVSGVSLGGNATATRFVINLDNGHTWTLYVPQQTAVQFDDRHTLRFQSSYSGPVRLAVVPSVGAQDTLDAHAATFPTAAVVSYDAAASSISYDFTAVGDATQLLMLALPHHIDALTAPAASSPSSFRTLMGEMHFVVGAHWELGVDAPPLEWLASAAGLSSDQRSNLTALLHADLVNLTADATDAYHFGTQMSKIARLALVADELQEAAAAAQCRALIKDKLRAFLVANASLDSLVYADQWGGVVSSAGLWDQAIDSGNGWFADHHIQYGPLFFAAAAVLKAEPAAWADDERVEGTLLLLARDVASSSAADAFFPVTRHKDWFDWISWSNGINSTQARSVSSVAESASAYHSLALFAAATNRSELADFARLMCATELAAARAYWLAANTNSTAALVASLSLQHVSAPASLALALPPLVRPLGPLTARLFPADLVAALDARLADSAASLAPPLSVYASFAHLVRAQLNATAAVAGLSLLPQLDASESRTHALYWAATRTAPANASVAPVSATSPPAAAAQGYYLRAVFSASLEAAAESRTSVDAGAPFDSKRGYGWVGAEPTLAPRAFPPAFGNFESVAIMPAGGEWRVQLRPGSGDVVVRVALAPATSGAECGGLAVHDTVAACDPDAPLTWSTLVPRLDSRSVSLVSAGDNTALVAVEVFPANGTVVRVSYAHTEEAPTPALMAAVTGVAAERFVVRPVNARRADVFVLDAPLFASALGADAIAAVMQRAPLALWEARGLSVETVQNTKSAPRKGSGRAFLSPGATAALILGLMVVVSLVIAAIWISRRWRKAQGAAAADERGAPSARPVAAPNSTQDLLRPDSAVTVASEANLSSEPAVQVLKYSDL